MRSSIIPLQKQPPEVIIKKRSWKFRNIHRKIPVLESLFNIVADDQDCNVIKKRLQHRCFFVNIAKSLRTPILKIICERLLLPLEEFCNFVYISYGNSHIHTRRLYVASAYLFFKPFVPNTPFLYHLKTSENHRG